VTPGGRDPRREVGALREARDGETGERHLVAVVEAPQHLLRRSEEEGVDAPEAGEALEERQHVAFHRPRDRAVEAVHRGERQDLGHDIAGPRGVEP